MTILTDDNLLDELLHLKKWEAILQLKQSL